MRELKGELREFKIHIVDRIKRLERNEGKRAQFIISLVSVVIAGLALLFGWYTHT
jgi:hypothetical protein